MSMALCHLQLATELHRLHHSAWFWCPHLRLLSSVLDLFTELKIIAGCFAKLVKFVWSLPNYVREVTLLTWSKKGKCSSFTVIVFSSTKTSFDTRYRLAPRPGSRVFSTFYDLALDCLVATWQAFCWSTPDSQKRRFPGQKRSLLLKSLKFDMTIITDYRAVTDG